MKRGFGASYLASVLAAALLLALSPFNALFSAPAPGAVPGAPDSWKMELVASAPVINHPSVVVCAPDGKVFVAEDPMDITRPAHVNEGRILCFHPGGKVTVFAERLHAVFGMQYLEGRLYVLHNPKFTVFRDDNGIGRDREDVLEQTNPNPWALDWNDHVPANFRLAMDGRFYIAVGDKGIYGARGRDGKRVDLHGGGILRMRPDGTELEVYSTGVRNILDVGMTAEDDIFTYDNTDENHWMGRVTHMVDGGFYGYPFDFIPQRPYTLWMFADYGAGAATGAEVYNHDAISPEWHGNLFLADFGQRNVRRVPLIRKGASFAAGKDQQLFSNPPGDFRPVGIAFSDDGRSLYVCDWQHRDTKEPAVAGRLWRMTWAGPDLSRARPDWYVAAATGASPRISPGELLEALGHPSRAVRLVAQRQLAKVRNQSGVDVDAALLALLKSPDSPAAARMHAIWAMDSRDGGTTGRSVILAAASETNRMVARQAIRQLGNRRVLDAVTTLTNRLSSADPLLVFEAATALGRIGAPQAVPALLAVAGIDDLFARHAVFVSLNRIGRQSETAWSGIVEGLGSKSERIQESTRFALRETFDERLVTRLVEFYKRQPVDRIDARRNAIQVLAQLHHLPPQWNGEWWAYHPFRLSKPARTNEWGGTTSVLEILSLALHDASPTIRESAIAGLEDFGTSSAGNQLISHWKRESVPALRQRLIQALIHLRSPGTQTIVQDILENNGSDPALVKSAIELAATVGGTEMTAVLMSMAGKSEANANSRQAIEALGTLKSTNSLPLLYSIATSGNPDHRSAALVALGRIGGEPQAALAARLLNDPDESVRKAAVQSLTLLKSTSQVPALIEAWKNHPEMRVAILEAMVVTPDQRALPIYLEGLNSRQSSVRSSIRKALSKIGPPAFQGVLDSLDKIPTSVVAELQQTFKGLPAARDTRLFSIPTSRPDRDAFLAFALENQGDAERGEKVFKDLTGASCIQCHRVKGEGQDIGPDLSGIGAQFDRRALVDSILWPSRAVREGYAVTELELQDGQELSGMIRAESAGSLWLQPAAGNAVEIKKSSIRKRNTTRTSLMPEGLEAALSLEEFADLVSFLTSLRSGT